MKKYAILTIACLIYYWPVEVVVITVGGAIYVGWRIHTRIPESIGITAPLPPDDDTPYPCTHIATITGYTGSTITVDTHRLK